MIKIEELDNYLNEDQKKELTNIVYEKVKAEIERMDISEVVRKGTEELIQYIFDERIDCEDIGREIGSWMLDKIQEILKEVYPKKKNNK